VTFERDGHANLPFLLQVDVAGDWNANGSKTITISKLIPNGYGLKLTLYQFTFESLTRFFGE
jgi:hypothetical protein